MHSRLQASVRLFALALVATLSAGCQTLNESGVGALINQVASGNIPISVAIDRQTIDGAGQTLLQSCDENTGALPTGDAFSEIAIDINSQQEMAGASGVASLRSLTLTDIRLNIVDVPEGDSDNFDFLKAVSFYGQDGDEEHLLARLDPVPEGVSSIVIPGTDFNLKSMASSANFKIKTRARGRLPCDDVVVVGTARFIARPL